MIVIVGHGPSILSGLGAVIDSATVVRLKHGRMREAENWGTRTDYICGRGAFFAKPHAEFWHFMDDSPWLRYFEQFAPRHSLGLHGSIVPKPSHGLCAAFMAMEKLNPDELCFIGCDTLLDPSVEFRKWNSPGRWTNPHDWHAERAALDGLGVKITDLRDVSPKDITSCSRPKTQAIRAATR